MGTSVYFSTYYLGDPDYLRNNILDNYILKISGLSSKMDILMEPEIGHPTIILDVNVLEIVSISAGDYIHYELNGVIILSTRITKVKKDIARFTITVETVDVIENLRNYTMEQVWTYGLEPDFISHNEKEYMYNDDVYDTKHHYCQLRFLLKVLLWMTGFPITRLIMEQIQDVSSPYYSSIIYNVDPYILFEDLVFSIELLQVMGKTSDTDENSANAYDVFILILRILGLKYYYQNENIVIDRILDIPSIPETVKGYKEEEMTGSIGIKLTAEFLDVNMSNSIFNDSSDRLTIGHWFSNHPGEAWGTETAEFNDENADQLISINLPTNFVVLYNTQYGLSHIPYVNPNIPEIGNTLFPWDFPGSIYFQMKDYLKSRTIVSTEQEMIKYQVDMEPHFDHNYNEITIDVENFLTKVTGYFKRDI